MKIDLIFLELFNRSMAAGWLILAVMALRLFLKKAPPWMRCVLWALVAVRLVCPISLESAFSLIPSAQTLSPATVQFARDPEITSGVELINQAVNPILRDSMTPAPGASVNPLYIWTYLAGILWAIGAALFLCHMLLSYWRLGRKLAEAVPLRDRVWLCDAVASPFILGVLRPRIYLPSRIKEEQMDYVLAHEEAHLKRRDHWWKLLGYLLLAVYWFHPLSWAAYHLFCKDLELACDQRVIRHMDLAKRKAYSHALVSCSVQKKRLAACPLAFGEIGVKERVLTVLNYKKPAFWLIWAAVLACILAALCFLTNPKEDPFDLQIIVPAGIEEIYCFSQEEFSPSEKSIQASAGEGLGDTKFTDSTDAIRAAILKENHAPQPEMDHFPCCDFVLLAEEHRSPADGSHTPHLVTFYGWAMYQQYHISKTGIEDQAGSHIPVALSFELDQSGYHLKEYWIPREGSYFVPDVREKFPDSCAGDAIDSQKFGWQQLQSCYRQAVEFSGLDTDAVIDRLLEELCSSFSASSNPRDYIDAGELNYREMLYYGEYTLRYCFRLFDQGGETGLKGQIMALACEELLQTRGTIPADAGTSETGQAWYETLRAHAGNMVEPYLD